MAALGFTFRAEAAPVSVAPPLTLADAAIALGVPVFPCLSNKHPACESGFKDASADPDTIRAMFAKPGAALIGMPTGAASGVVGIDVDTKNGKVGAQWLEANRHRLPRTHTVRTGSGGLHFYFRHPGQRVKNNNTGKVATDVDVRGDGGYLIAAGSPGYQVADHWAAADLPDWLLEIVCQPEPEPAAPRAIGARAALADGNTPYGLAALDGECEAIRSASFGQQEGTLNAAGLKIGALAAGGEMLEGPAIAALIAAGMDMPNEPKRERWTAQDIEAKVRRAVRDGMRNARQAPERQAEPEEVHPAAELIAKLHAKAAKAAAKPLPVAPSLMEVGGVLKLLLDEGLASAQFPQPFLALGAAICAVGVLAGRKYRTRTDLRSNIYAAAIAESAAGKDHTIAFARRAIEAAGLKHYLAGQNIASGQGLLSALEEHPAALFQIDELGIFLAGTTGKNAPPHLARIWSELMKLFSCVKSTYGGTDYANKKERARIDINQPHCCLYGATTPSTFWAAMEGGAMLDGSLARFLVFVAEGERPQRNWDAGIFTPSAALIAGLQAIAAGHGGLPAGGNLPAVYTAPMVATEEASPYTVLATEAADQLHRHEFDRNDRWYRQVGTGPQIAIIGRIAEHADKLALIRAVSRNPVDPVIDEGDIAWGWALANHCARSLLKDAAANIADNEFQAKQNKALGIIQQNGTVATGDFHKLGFRLPPRERDEVLASLVEGGAIRELPPERAGAGRPTKRYAVVAGAMMVGGAPDDDD